MSPRRSGPATTPMITSELTPSITHDISIINGLESNRLRALQMTNLSPDSHAAVLIEALPYLKQFYGKTIVVKYGGNAMIHETLKQQVMQDIALLHYVGIRTVLVHGGGPEISAIMKQMGHEPAFV